MNKRGSLFVEAAILFPMFLLAILSICVLIRIIGSEENMVRSLTEEGHKIAKEAYVTQLDFIPESYSIELLEGIVHGTLLEFRMLERLKNEDKLVKNPRIDRFEYLYAEGHQSGLIHCSIAYDILLPMPLSFHRQPEFEQRLLFRGFIGAENCGEGMGFDSMEEPDDASIVYIFPRAGERFHQLQCRIIEVYPRQMILSPSLRKKYTPCKLCNGDLMPWGSRVYCFDKSGRVYHKGNCTTVERYVVGIDREEAIENGYSPCAYCGG